MANDLVPAVAHYARSWRCLDVPLVGRAARRRSTARVYLEVYTPDEAVFGPVPEGKTVVLMPGYSMPAEAYDPLCQILVAEGYRVIVVDMFNSPSGVKRGGSVLDQIRQIQSAALDDSFRLYGPLVVIGHSIGARIAAGITPDKPFVVKQVWIAPAFDIRTWLTVVAYLVGWRPIVSVAMSVPNLDLRGIATAVFTYLLGETAHETAQLIARDLWSTPHDATDEALIGAATLRAAGTMVVPAPLIDTLCVWGDVDNLANVIAIDGDHVHVEHVEGGHLPPVSELRTAIVGFLAS